MDVAKPFLVENILAKDDRSRKQQLNDINAEAEWDEQEDQAEETKQTSSQNVEVDLANKRKIRRCFRIEQLEYLERCFMQVIYPEASMRKRIAQDLKVSSARVQVWFQNRRAKARRQWKQQNGNSAASSSSRSPKCPPKSLIPSNLQWQFANSGYQYDRQLRREFCLEMYSPASTTAPVPGGQEHRVQGPLLSTPLCSCCSNTPSFVYFKRYEHQRSLSTGRLSEHLPCKCLSTRPRPTCMS